jgi:hypothetical protein
MSKKRKFEEDTLTPLSRSNFKRYYSISTAPRSIETLMGALDEFVESYFRLHDGPGGWMVAKYSFDQSIKLSAVSKYNKCIENNEERSSAIEKVAKSLWTSDQENSCTKGKKQFFSMVNESIRRDDSDLMRPLALIVRAINKLCLYKSDVFPEEGFCWRGGGMMASNRDFFVRGKKYRVPGFLATSFSIKVAKSFLNYAGDRGEEPILWTVILDERGETQPKHRCLHVNLLNSHKHGEQEFLFVPYSTFTVQSVTWSPFPNREMPHRVTIVAANDNKAEPEDLPVAPWY